MEVSAGSRTTWDALLVESSVPMGEMFTIYGQVVSYDDGAPVAGAELTLNEYGAISTATTDDQGRFEMEIKKRWVVRGLAGGFLRIKREHYSIFDRPVRLRENTCFRSTAVKPCRDPTASRQRCASQTDQGLRVSLGGPLDAASRSASSRRDVTSRRR